VNVAPTSQRRQPVEQAGSPGRERKASRRVSSPAVARRRRDSGRA
jgi:hypothetical protein